MKYMKFLAITILLSINNIQAKELVTELDKKSYSLGLKTGEQYRQQEITLDPGSFYSGMLTGINNKTPALSDKENIYSTCKITNRAKLLKIIRK